MLRLRSVHAHLSLVVSTLLLFPRLVMQLVSTLTVRVIAHTSQIRMAQWGLVDPNIDGTYKGVNSVPFPCFCPPNRQVFIDILSASVSSGQINGVPVSFPTGSSKPDRLMRIQAAIAIFQNFKGGFGVGCPASSTTFVQQQQAIINS